MAKRFIDTSKYRAQWRTMPINARLTFYWLWENCDAGGVWEIDPDYFKFQTSMKWDTDAIIKHLSGHVVKISAHAVWLVEFIEVNYGELKDGYNPHKPAIRSALHYGLNVPLQDVTKLGKVPGNRSRVTKKVRETIMVRDGMACQYCATRLEAEAIVIDHLLPVAMGGDSSDENLITSCFRCNSIKGQLPPEEFVNARHPFLNVAQQILIKLDKKIQRLEDEDEDEDTSSEVERAKVTEAVLWPSFSDFWEAYEKKGNRKTSAQKWERLDQSEREAIMAYVPAYIASKPEKKFRKDGERFLEHRVWEDEIINTTNDGTRGPTLAEQDAAIDRIAAERWGA